MKIRFLILLFAFVGSFAFAQKAPEASPAQFTAEVVDEDGKPLKDMGIMTSFASENSYPVGLTDSNGLFVARCEKVMLGEVGFSVNHGVPGYYETRVRYDFNKISNGRWEPWDPVVQAVVKRIVHPIALYARKVETMILATNVQFGYDLIVGDWVQPSGRGTISDMVFTVDGYWQDYRNNDAVLRLTFSGEQDGLVHCDYPLNRGSPSGSQLFMPRIACENGYESELKLRKFSKRYPGENREARESDIKEGRGYLFRVRSQTNEYGAVTNALYGKLTRNFDFGGASEDGCYLKFTYYLNPTPNDRNLEFDPKRNLFKNLKSTEEVREP